MLALRYAPVPWRLKRRVIRLTQPKVIVISVAVIPDAAGNVLLLRARYAGRWQLPGGVVHGGEDPRSGVVRECAEELGLPVRVERLTGIYADRLGPELAFCFRCAPLAGTPVLSPEHEAFRYVAPDRSAPRLRQMIQDVRRRLHRITINSGTRPERLLACTHEHLEVADAIVRGDSPSAAVLMRKHIDKMSESAMALIRTYIVPVRGERF